MSNDIFSLLDATVKAGASDLHLSGGRPPLIRLRGEVAPIPGHDEVLTGDLIQNEVFKLINDEQKARLSEHLELDFSYEVRGLARFRINTFYQRMGMALVARVIPGVIPSAEEVGLPPAIVNLGHLHNGLVLVAGPTGSGKSTTMACIINDINMREARHILTIEDPMEFVFPVGKCLISQREVGSSTHSFKNALRAGLRQDPDVILVGELRDLETISLAVSAAETGHLVFGTVHTTDAASTVDRLVDAFAPHQQQQIRSQLSNSLRAVVCQQLLPHADGRGRVACREIMIVNYAISNLIRSGKAQEVPNAIMSGADAGMVLMDRDIKRLVECGQVSLEVARSKVKDPNLLGVMATPAMTSFEPAAAPKKKGFFG
jgi:twitching motility protein PilT